MTEREKKTPKGTWLRLYTTLLEDHVFMTLTPQAVSTYLKLYLLAKRVDSRGGILPPGVLGDKRGPYDFRDIVYELRENGNEGSLQASINELVSAGMIDLVSGSYSIASYEEEQETYQEYAERKQKGREYTERWRGKAAGSALMEAGDHKNEDEYEAWAFKVCKSMGYTDQSASKYSRKPKPEFLAHLEILSKKDSTIAATELSAYREQERTKRDEETMRSQEEKRNQVTAVSVPQEPWRRLWHELRVRKSFGPLTPTLEDVLRDTETIANLSDKEKIQSLSEKESEILVTLVARCNQFATKRNQRVEV